ncbi:MAG: hypothetical protein ACT4P1_01285 [Sporichthyaceae bacterium]
MVSVGVQPVSAATEDEIEATLGAAVATAEAAQAVRSGRLTKALSYAGFGDVEITGAVALARPGLRAVPAAPAETAPEPQESTERKQEQRKRQQRERELARARDEVRATERALGQARVEVGELEQRLARAREAQVAAQAAADAAAAALRALEI